MDMLKPGDVTIVLALNLVIVVDIVSPGVKVLVKPNAREIEVETVSPAEATIVRALCLTTVTATVKVGEVILAYSNARETVVDILREVAISYAARIN